MSPSYGGFLVTLFKIGNIYSHLAFTISSILFSFYPPKHSLHSAAAAAAKLLQSCPTLCDLIDGSPPGSPILGFSRQEHWSGLPFPSPVNESENESEVSQSCPTLHDPMDCSLPGSSVHGSFPARVLEWGAIAFSLVVLDKL